jgi:hypothetical protein
MGVFKLRTNTMLFNNDLLASLLLPVSTIPTSPFPAESFDPTF